MLTDPSITPPKDDAAERAVLGSCLRDNRLIPEVELVLSPEHFYEHNHQVVWRCMLSFGAKPVDLVTLSSRLAETGEVQDAGGYPYLVQLFEAAPTTANALYYADVVARLAQRRWYIHAATDILREARDPSDPDALADWAEQTIFAVRMKQRGTETAKLTPECNDILEYLDTVVANQQAKKVGMPLGIPELDELTSLEPGTLVTLAARTSVGKSILLEQIAVNVATAGYPTLLCSLEMRRKELAQRAMSCVGSIRFHAIRGEALPAADEVARAIEARTELSRIPLFVNSTFGMPIAAIAAEARRAKAKHQLALLAVDYVQLVHAERQRGMSRAEALGTITKRLKDLAGELDICVLTASQINREAEKNAHGKPTLASLKESGSLEEDSDVVYLVWPGDTEEDINVEIAKQRNGPRGQTVQLFKNAAYMRFQSAATKWRG